MDEIVRGWRAYGYEWHPAKKPIDDEFGERTRIYLVGQYGHVWPGLQLKAKCGSFLLPHQAPEDNCRCGIYIASYIQNVESFGTSIIASVIGFGKVIEYTEGWRVEHCRIEKIWSKDWKVIEYLSRHYEVPIGLISHSSPVFYRQLGECKCGTTYYHCSFCDNPICHNCVIEHRLKGCRRLTSKELESLGINTEF